MAEPSLLYSNNSSDSSVNSNMAHMEFKISTEDVTRYLTQEEYTGLTRNSLRRKRGTEGTYLKEKASNRVVMDQVVTVFISVIKFYQKCSSGCWMSYNCACCGDK